MTTIPVAKLWIIQAPKLVSYLLNLGHPKGGPKAQLLIQFGFDPARPEVLANAIAEQAIRHGPGQTTVPPLGLSRSVVEGDMNTPSGRALNVRTVWEQMSARECRFITMTFP